MDIQKEITKVKNLIAYHRTNYDNPSVVDRMIAERESRIAKLIDEINQLRESRARAPKLISELKKRLKTLEKIAEVSSTQKKIDELIALQSKTRDRLREARTKLIGIESTIASLKAKQAASDVPNTGLEKRLAGLERRKAEIEAILEL